VALYWYLLIHLVTLALQKLRDLTALDAAEALTPLGQHLVCTHAVTPTVFTLLTRYFQNERRVLRLTATERITDP
jgi:hypothetical protein